MLKGYIQNYLSKRAVLDIENTKPQHLESFEQKSKTSKKYKSQQPQPKRAPLNRELNAFRIPDQNKSHDQQTKLDQTLQKTNHMILQNLKQLSSINRKNLVELQQSKKNQIRKFSQRQTIQSDLNDRDELSLQESSNRDQPRQQIKNMIRHQKKYSLQRLSDNNFDVVMQMKNELIQMRKAFGNKISDQFLDQIEVRDVVFVEDGTDLRKLKIGQTEGQEVYKEFYSRDKKLMKELSIKDNKSNEIRWKKYPQQITININKYLAKYNFEIAHQIPEDCKLIIVSENEPQIMNDEDVLFDLKGLKGNIYEFQNGKDSQNFESKRIKQKITKSKDKWFMQNLKLWNQFTPGISNANKFDDFVSHFNNGNDKDFHRLQSSSNGRPQMPQSRQINARLQTAAIYSLDSQRQSRLQKQTPYNNEQGNLSQFSANSGQQNFSQLFLEQKKNSMEPMNMDNFFRKTTPYGHLPGVRDSSNSVMKLHQEDINERELQNALQLQNPVLYHPNGQYNKSFLTETQMPQGVRSPVLPKFQASFSVKNQQMANNKSFQGKMQREEVSPMALLPQGFNQSNYQKLSGNGYSRLSSKTKTPNHNGNITRKQTAGAKTHKNGDITARKQQSQQSQKLSYNEIEAWAKKYDLSWKEIYELDSEYQSLIKIDKEDILNLGKSKKQDQDFSQQQEQENVTSKAQIAHKINEGEQGISVKVFKEYCKVFQDKMPEVRDTIIQAFGIDISNQNSKVGWEQYIMLKSFLQFFTLQKSELIKIWIKVLDPHGIRHVSRHKVQDFLELLARGTVTEEQTLVSKEFARNVIRLFEAEGCLSENFHEVLIEKVEQCFKEEIIDVEVINQVLKIECLYIVKSINHNFS